MPTIALNPELCKAEGNCAKMCPSRIFAMKEKGAPPEISREELCVKCGLCVAVCPGGALAHEGLDPARFERFGERPPTDPDAFVRCLVARRSIRAYKNKPVPRALLEKIARVAGFSPGSAHGGENWTRTVALVDGEERMRRVRDFTAEYMRRTDALLDGFFMRLFARVSEEVRGGRAMLGDMRMRLEELGAGRDAVTYDAPAAIFVHAPRGMPEPKAHCDAALMAMLLAAHAYGLGTCWNGYIAKAASGYKLKSFRELREWLGVPDHHDVYAAATIGYPAVTLHSLPHRETAIRWID
jgi:nitroreductase/NAD-dependent dihydropyrimidine dehydrogenase PreA subunit